MPYWYLDTPETGALQIPIVPGEAVKSAAPDHPYKPVANSNTIWFGLTSNQWAQIVVKKDGKPFTGWRAMGQGYVMRPQLYWPESAHASKWKGALGEKGKKGKGNHLANFYLTASEPGVVTTTPVAQPTMESTLEFDPSHPPDDSGILPEPVVPDTRPALWPWLLVLGAAGVWYVWGQR